MRIILSKIEIQKAIKMFLKKIQKIPQNAEKIRSVAMVFTVLVPNSSKKNKKIHKLLIMCVCVLPNSGMGV